MNRIKNILKASTIVRQKIYEINSSFEMLSEVVLECPFSFKKRIYLTRTMIYKG